MKVYDIHECMFQKLHLVGSKHREIGKGSAGKNITMTKIENGNNAVCGNRTHDHMVKSHALYQLS